MNEKVIQMPDKEVKALRRDVAKAIKLQEAENWVVPSKAAEILDVKVKTLCNRSAPSGNLIKDVHWKLSPIGKLFNIAALKGFT